MKSTRTFLLVTSLVFLAAGVLADPARAQDHLVVTLEGTFAMDRQPKGQCVLVFPRTLSGNLQLVVDVTAGTVSGELQGKPSSGQVTGPLCDTEGGQPVTSCGKWDSTYGSCEEIHRWEHSYTGSLRGTFDPATGALSAQVTYEVTGFYESVCGPGQTCYGIKPVPVKSPQSGALSGTLRRDGAARGEFKWYTNTCMHIFFAPGKTNVINSKFGEQYCNSVGQWNANGEAWSLNQDPIIKRMGYAPEEPDSADDVVITVEAEDPDGDQLAYAWTADGEAQASKTNSVTWRKPPAGDHEVSVTVTDGQGGKTSDSIWFRALEHVGPGDLDKDGVNDDDDLCPGEWAELAADGCPEFAAAVACDPLHLQPEQPIACTAKLAGVRKTESPLTSWYLDGSPVGAENVLSWTWSKAEPGEHEISFVATGEEGREARGAIPVAVGERLSLRATIAMAPDPPVPDKALVFTAVVEGTRYNEAVTYEWSFDGQLLCTVEVCTIGKAPLGSHTMNLAVRGGDADRIATDARTVTVIAPALIPADPEAAGFRINGPDCNENVTSDGTLSCAAQFRRLGTEVGLFDVTWLIDGAVATNETVLDGSTLGLDRVPPGEHTVEVRVTDTLSGKTQVGVASVNIAPGPSAVGVPGVPDPSMSPIPPATQAAAAGGTLTALGAWLWLEWLLARQEARRAAAAEAEEERLSRERAAEFEKWSAEQQARRAEKRRAEGFDYDPASDSWVRSQAYLDAQERAQKKLSDDLARNAQFIERLKQQLPRSEWVKIDHLLSEIYSPEHPTADDLARLQRLKRAVYNKVQGQYEGQAAQAEMDALDWGAYETAASRMRTGAAVAGLGLVLLPGGVAAAAQLAAFNLGLNAVGGLLEGYSEGGLAQGLWQAARYTLPVNTVYEALIKRDPKAGALGIAVSIGLGLLQDVGNVFNLRQGAPRLGRELGLLDEVRLPSNAERLAQAKEAMSEAAAHRLSGSVDDVPVARIAPAEPLSAAASGISEAERAALVARKAELKELQALEDRELRAFTDYLRSKPASHGGSPVFAEAKELELKQIDLNLKNDLLSRLSKTPDPSPATVQEIARLETETKQLTSRVEELADTVDEAACKFYGVNTPDEITDDVINAHLRDGIASGVGEEGMARLTELRNKGICPPGVKPEEAIAEVVKKLGTRVVVPKAAAPGSKTM